MFTKENLTAAVKFWEPRRLVFNFALLAMVVAQIARHEVWGVFKDGGTLANLFLLGFIANVLFCLAYLPDLVLRFTDISESWKSRGRYIVLISGTIFSLIIAFFVMEDLTYYHKP